MQKFITSRKINKIKYYQDPEARFIADFTCYLILTLIIGIIIGNIIE